MVDPQKTCESDCSAGVNGSNPIHTALGIKLQHEVDFTLPDGLAFSRYYSSASHWSLRTMGQHWRHNFDASVLLSDGSPWGRPTTAWVNRPDGSSYAFNKSGASWTPEADVTFSLTAEYAGTQLTGWVLRDKSNRIERYDFDGRLLSLEGPNWGPVFLAYDLKGQLESVTDQKGRSITLLYDASSGLLTDMADPAGANYHFEYDSQNRLVSVRKPGLSGQTALRKYNYENPAYPFALTGITDENDNRYASWGYDSAGRANLSVHGAIADLVDRYLFTFNADGTTTIVDPLNQSRTFSFLLSHGVKRFKGLSEFCLACGGSTASDVTYDVNGFPDVTTHFDGTKTDKDFNARGLLVQQVESTNRPETKRTTQTDWNTSFSVPDERRIFDETGRLVSKRTWLYNARSQVTASTLHSLGFEPARTTSFTYCEQIGVDAGTCPLVGLLLSVDGPRADVADVTSYTYYSSDESSCATAPTTCPHRKGDLWKVTNALNQVTEFLRYDGAGRVLSSKDANGVVTDREYHPRGWLTATKVRGTNDASEADDQTTRIDYYPTGLVEKTTLPDGSLTRFEYDAAHRLTKIFDNVGNSIVYSLDDAGNRTGEKTKDASGTLLRTLSRVYDQLGRLREVKDAYERGASFTYDAIGNLDTSTDALLHVTDNDYDPLNRLEQTLQDVGGIQAKTKFAYDALDNLRKVTDPKNLNTEYEYNGFGDLVRLKSPDSGETTYAYDSAGNRSSQTDARGVTTSYTYDALNRLKSVSYSDGTPSVSYVYDVEERKLICRSLSYPSLSYAYQVGRLGYMVDASGLTRFCYDRFGRLFAKGQITNGKSFITQYKYNEGGALASIIYPSGASVGYVRNSNGQVSGMTWTPSGGTAQVLLTSVSYYPFGPPAEIEYGDGRRLARSLNLNYQPGIIQDLGPDGLSLGFEFDPVGNLSVLRNGTQSDPPLRFFAYDALSRLKEVDNGSGLLLWGYDYDATGNRLAAQDGAVSASYAYPAESHRLSSVGGVARSYDAAGNTTGIGGTAQQFVFDGGNRMAQALKAGTVVMNYIYNGKGEQVRRFPTASSTEQNYFTYDESGHLLGIYNASGQRLQEFIWLDDLPVGVVASNKLHYIEPDHLGTPRVVIDPTRERAVWNWGLTGEVFGKSAPDEDPDGDGIPLVVDLRFPGQRYDAASELNYNYFRDYEAGTGRYVESDPLGLRAGVGTFVYVLDNPLLNADPAGLQGVAGYGTTSCSYYSQRCKQQGGVYYCRMAPLVCAETPDGRWSRCVRRCLQEADSGFCKLNDGKCSGSDTICIINIHQICWQECLRKEGPPAFP